MKKEEAERIITDLLETAETCYLSTIDAEGFPQTRAMLNLRNTSQYPGLIPLFRASDNYMVYISTNTSSDKISQIKNNSRISVYYSKPAQWKGLMLGGKAEIITDSDMKEKIWQQGWEMYYPGGVKDEDYALLRLKPDILKLYHNLQNFTLAPEQK